MGYKSKRASYHYALSEGLLAFANGRSLDTAYAFLNADAEVSGAMAKMLTTGETKFAAELDPKLAMAFYADTMVGLAELQEGYADYIRAQDPYRKMLNTLFELNPDKSPEGLYPAPEMAPKRSLKDDASLEDGYLLQNRRAYFKEISKRFLDKIKKEFYKELRKAVDIVEIEYHQAYYSNYCDGFVFIKTNYERFYDKTRHSFSTNDSLQASSSNI